MIILCVSDSFGHCEACGRLATIREWLADHPEDEDDEYIYSCYKIKDEDWTHGDDIILDIDGSHPSHWLDDNGIELTAGDFL